MKALILCLGAIALAGTARAEMSCLFETECLEGEACLDSGYDLTINADLDLPAIFSGEFLAVYFPADTTIETVSGTITDVSWNLIDGAVALMGRDASGFHFLSLNAEGRARYSVHMPDADLAIHYIGTCTKED